jgi:hypothetical protein
MGESDICIVLYAVRDGDRIGEDERKERKNIEIQKKTILSIPSDPLSFYFCSCCCKRTLRV